LTGSGHLIALKVYQNRLKSINFIITTK